VTGTGLAPFLEDGPVLTSSEWDEITALLEGNFFGYAVWFN
jgi:hypothetical protein